MSSSTKIVAVDATNQAHIVWHGSRGQCDVGQVLLGRVRAIEADWSPAKVICCFDSRESFRKQLDPTYKAHRQQTPDALRQQLVDAINRIGKSGIPVVGAEGFEADDGIASVCHHARRRGLKAIIVSSDKDVRQLLVSGAVTIADQIRVINGKLAPKFFTAGSVVERYGIRPDQWIDWQCLVGDKCDGIHGADSIGEKIATRLLQEAGTLDRLLDNPWKFARHVAVRDSLFEFKTRVHIVRQLVTLRTDVPFVEDCF